MGEGVNVGEALEEDGLALHDGKGRVGTDVAQAENRRPVGDDGHHVGLGGHFEDGIPVPPDLPAGFGHSGSVGQGQVGHGVDGHLAFDGHLALFRPVQIQGLCVDFLASHERTSFAEMKNI